MEVFALLPDPLLARLRSALGPDHQIRPVSDVRNLSRALRTGAHGIALLDPMLIPAEELDLLRHCIESHPTVVFSAYTALTPSAMQTVINLAATGMRQVIVKGYDDEPDAFRARLELLPATTLGERVIAQLHDSLGQLPEPVRGAVERLFRQPRTLNEVDEFVRGSGLPRRSFDRALQRAGLATARHILRCARVVRAYPLLRNGGYSPEAIADRLGYASSQQFWRHVKAATGFGFGALRDQLEPEAFVAQIGARMRRGR